jgi:heat shock protein HtpX
VHAVHGHEQRAAALTGAVARLAITVVLLAVACAAIGMAVAGGLGIVVAVVLVVVLVVAAFLNGDQMALSAMAARPVSEVEHPDLYRLVRELSKAGRLPVPRLYLSPAGQPNSFTVGLGPRSAAVCCTEGLLSELDEAELRGVLGHELAHSSGRDLLASTVAAGLATVITFPAGLARLLPGRAGTGPHASALDGSSGLGLSESLLMLVFGPIAALVIRCSVSQAREFRADAAGAQLAGDPIALSSALRKIDAGADELALAPDGRLTSVGHLMIACPFRADGIARVFLMHPPMGERIRRLEALAGYRRLPVVDELDREVEFLALEQGDDRLQVVLLLRRDPELLALDLGAHGLRSLVPDDLRELLGVVLADALLEGDAHPVLLAREPGLGRVQRLQRDAPLD